MAPKEPRSTRRLSMKGGLNRKLRFDGSMNEPEVLEKILEARHNAQYTIMTFDEVFFTPKITAAVVDFLRTTSRYGRMWDRLNLEFCEGMVDLIVSSAMTLDSIKHLFLASDENQDDLMIRFSSALMINDSLQSVWLLIPFSETSAAALGEGLAYNTTLDKLSLSGSNWDNLGDIEETGDGDDCDIDEKEDYDAPSSPSNAPLALAKGLGQNTDLRVLDLSCCYLQDDGMTTLIGSLVGQPNLQILDVSRNHCRDSSLRALGELVRHEDSRLVSLDLREQTKANPLNLKTFSHSLFGNETLEILKLSHNRLPDVQVVDLVHHLRGNCTLQELDLQWNHITEKGLNVITEHLQEELSALAVLLLGGNSFGNEGFKKLEKLQDDDESICTVGEEDLHDSYQNCYSGSITGGEMLGSIYEYS